MAGPGRPAADAQFPLASPPTTASTVTAAATHFDFMCDISESGRQTF
jgi:hypothetical protein